MSGSLGDFFQTVFMVMLFMIFMVLLPVALVVATPFVLLWPGKRLPGGGRAKRDIEGRYRKILSVWIELGKGIA
ncbi:MAG: hypothetical protein PVF95_00045 [bacterium]